MEILKKVFAPFKAVLDFIRDYFKVVVFLFIVFLIVDFGNSKKEEEYTSSPFTQILGLPSKDQPKNYNLVEMELKGVIFSAEEFLSKLKRFDNNQTKGLLLKIDSPGGSVPPSVEISIALKRFAERIPVVVYAQGVMASGAYYAGVYANKIVANPGSLIGSIGIIYQGANIKEMLDKLGIEPQVMKAGIYKETGAFYRPWNEAEKEELRAILDAHYNEFVSTVADARGLDINSSYLFAEGRIFDAKRAKALGLVDSLGIAEDARKELIAISGVSKPIWYKDKDPKESLFSVFTQGIAKELINALNGRIY